MNFRKWDELEEKDKEELLEKEKVYQLEPEHIYLAVERPRTQADRYVDLII